jgi:hypothetical protein
MASPWSWLITVPLNATGLDWSAGRIRLRTMKSLVFAPFWKVAVFPNGRKSMTPLP